MITKRNFSESTLKACLSFILILLISVPIVQGDEFKEPVTGMEFVFVKGGCFEMGDTFQEGEADESPVHTVCLDSFYLGKYEVTQKQWLKLMGNNPSAYPSGDLFPVEWISWKDAVLFIEKLNQTGNGTFRLPTEAEWEYACRAGGRKIRFGTQTGELNHSLANFGNGEWGEGDIRDGHEFTAPVGSYPPNALELYDMSGNVFEWVSDWKSLNENYYSKSPKHNPQGAKPSVRKVGRGGAWNFGPEHQRCSNRFSNWPDFHCLSYGFRVVKVP